MTVAGLEESPVKQAGGEVMITAQGLTLDFHNATVTRDGRTVTVALGP